MGARGPAPTPTEVLKARGSPHANTRTGEVAYPIDAPDCPKWLGKDAKLEWKRVVALLIEARCVATIDLALLTSYCQAWGEYIGLCRAIVKAGYAKAIKTGLMSARNKARDALVKIADRFGFSPAARTRVKAAEFGADETGPRLSLGTL